MARTQVGGDTILDGSIGVTDLEESVNSFGGKEPKIYRVSKYHSNFQEIDYTILNLFPRRTFDKGELIIVEWFKDIALTDLCLIVNITYTRDGAGFAQSRETRRRWINNDDTFNSYEKITIKDYTVNDGEPIKEGKKRREALVDNIQTPVLTAMHHVLLPKGWVSLDILMNGRRFLDEYEDFFSKFIKNSSTVTKKSDPNYGKKKIVVAFETEDDIEFLEWLDTPVMILDGQTIREFLINEFSI